MATTREIEVGATEVLNGTLQLALTLSKPGIRRRVRQSLIAEREGRSDGVVETQTDGTLTERPLRTPARLLTEEEAEVPILIDADKRQVAVAKIILDSPELRKVEEKHGEVRRWLYDVVLPNKLFKEGTYSVSLKSVQRVDEYLKKAAAETEELVNVAVAMYEQRQRETLAKLNGLGDPADYLSPFEFRNAFGFKWSWFALSVDARLKAIDLGLYEREEAKLQAEIASMVTDIREGLTASFAETVDYMVKIVSGEGGEAKRFKGSAFERVMTFLNTFSERASAIGNPPELEALVEQARNLASGIGPKDVRKDKDVRAALLQGFTKIQGELGKIASPKRGRDVSLDDEPGLPPARTPAAPVEAAA